jgi:hypothetical protein
MFGSAPVYKTYTITKGLELFKQVQKQTFGDCMSFINRFRIKPFVILYAL